MGRITIFSLQGCPFCDKAKVLLDDLGYEYSVIDLSSYPHRRKDMIALANKVTVPQIFFGEKHIGGYKQLEALESEDVLVVEFELMKNSPEPADERLAIPTEPPVEGEKFQLAVEKPICFKGQSECSMGYTDIQEFLRTSLDIRDRSKGFLRGTAKDTFSGKDFLDVMTAAFGLSREDMLVTGKHLMEEYKFFYNVDPKRATNMEDSENALYRLQVDSEKALNMGRLAEPTDADPLHAFAVIKGANQILTKDVIGSNTYHGLIDYVACAREPAFSDFERIVAELQNAQPEKLNDEQKVALFINIYNMMIKHAFIAVGIPDTNLARYRFYDSITYRIGKYDYSLNEIENGILRANSKAPYHLFRHFTSSDPRGALKLAKTEKRIHFALNCGAKSCPPVKAYSVEAIEEELRVVTEAFVEDEGNLVIDVANKTLTISTIFKWYSEDFGNRKDLHAFLLEHARGDRKQELTELGKTNFTLKYLPYDWSTNASKSMSYGQTLPGM